MMCTLLTDVCCCGLCLFSMAVQNMMCTLLTDTCGCGLCLYGVYNT